MLSGRVGGGVPPVVNELVAHRVGVVVGDDPSVLPVGRDRGVGVAVTELVEGGLFPDVDLATVAGQLDSVELLGEGAEQATGVDLGQLSVVTDRRHLHVKC